MTMLNPDSGSTNGARGPSRGRAPVLVAKSAPWLSLLLIAGLGTQLPTRIVDDAAAAERMREVAVRMEAVPRFIGEWTGVDEEVPPEAQKLLRPNATLSRIYRRPGGPALQVLVVHCRDARDMIGHYPPVCYPSAGWEALPLGEPVDATLDAGTSIPVRTYRYVRTRDAGRRDQIRIFNAFILPDGSVTPKIEEINRQSERRAVSAQGVAQLQVITEAGLDRAEAEAFSGEILRGMHELMESLRVGEGRTGPS